MKKIILSASVLSTLCFASTAFAGDASLASSTPSVVKTAMVNTAMVNTPMGMAPLAVNNWNDHPFSLQYADGRTLTSEQLKGKMVFIDAWATWCPPCMPSLPKFSKLYDKNHTNPHVKVLSVHLSDRYGRFSNAGEFLRARGLTYPVLQDPDSNLIEDIDITPLTSAVPHYVLLDGTGKIIRRYGEINDQVILDIENRFRAHTKAQMR